MTPIKGTWCNGIWYLDDKHGTPRHPDGTDSLPWVVNETSANQTRGFPGVKAYIVQIGGEVEDRSRFLDAKIFTVTTEQREMLIGRVRSQQTEQREMLIGRLGVRAEDSEEDKKVGLLRERFLLCRYLLHPYIMQYLFFCRRPQMQVEGELLPASFSLQRQYAGRDSLRSFLQKLRDKKTGQGFTELARGIGFQLFSALAFLRSSNTRIPDGWVTLDNVFVFPEGRVKLDLPLLSHNFYPSAGTNATGNESWGPDNHRIMKEVASLLVEIETGWHVDLEKLSQSQLEELLSGNENLLDLVGQCLKNETLTPNDAIAHKYFDEIRGVQLFDERLTRKAEQRFGRSPDGWSQDEMYSSYWAKMRPYSSNDPENYHPSSSLTSVMKTLVYNLGAGAQALVNKYMLVLTGTDADLFE